MRGPPRATWTNGVITGILSPHACPARCGARRRCGTAKLCSAPCLPLRAGTLLRHWSPRQAAHTPQRLIAHDDMSSTHPAIADMPLRLRFPAADTPHQFRHSAPDLRGSVQPSTAGPLCQTSCRLNRIGTLGARISESGSIRTSLQRSDSGETVATGEFVGGACVA